MVHATRSALVLLALLIAAAPAAGRQYRGHLRGVVLDPSGTAAAGVALRVTHEATGESRRVVAGPDGFYAVPDLLPGTYRVEADDDRYRGFVVRTAVAIGQDAELDLRLGAASISMTADVRPTLVPIDRHAPAVTARLDRSFLESLPLERHEYIEAAVLAPGMLPVGVAAAGAPEHFTGYVVDGLTWLTESRIGGPPTRMALDAVGEYEVRTSSFDASFGLAAGPQVSVATRSGTNRREGGAYGLFQPDGERAFVGGFAGVPIAPGRTFAFGSYQGAAVDGSDGDGHLLSARVDHLLAAARLTGRYALDTTPGAGHAQNAAAALHVAGSGGLTSEVRVGVSGVDAETAAAEYEATAFQAASVTSWARGRHLVRGGAQWYRRARAVGNVERSGHAVGLFVQDDWWVRPDISVSAGLRYDHASPENGGEASDKIAPRLGVTWTADREAKTLVRAGYGVAYNHQRLDDTVPRLDHWSLAVRRSLGRARSLEAAYLGSSGEDILTEVGGTSTYRALQVTLEERSEANLAAFVAYTYGKWTEEFEFFDGERRAPLDARHRLSAAFVAHLPFGAERRWFDDGLAGEILGNMQLSGVFTIRSGLPVTLDEQGPSLRTLDLALLKNLPLGLRRTLQLRLETYNLTDRLPAPRGRRLQLGARIVF